MRANLPPVYPFVLACYGPLSLAAANIYERVGAREVLATAAISVGVAAAVWAASFPLSRTRNQRAMLAAIAIVAFSSYGHVVQNPERPGWTIAIGALLLLVVAAAILRTGAEMRGLTTFLNGFSIVLVLMPAWRLTTWTHQGPEARPDTVPAHPPGRDANANTSRLPDLFVIVVDGYSGSQSLRRVYGFANDSLEHALERHGFIVPDRPRANYVHTFLSLASMLNARYLTEVSSDLRPSSKNRAWAYPLIESHRILTELAARGYEFVFFPTYYAATAQNRHADVQLPSPGGTGSEFAHSWLRLTPVTPLIHALCKRPRCRVEDWDLMPEPARVIDWKLAQLANLPASDRPVYALLHLLVPHDPYVYNADCSHREPYRVRLFPAEQESAVKVAYLAQVRCINRKLESLVGRLLQRPGPPPIVIIQSDHGFGRLGRGPRPYIDADSDQVAERIDAFAAYHYPGPASRLLYDSVTPVNAFRILLREYYGVPLAPIPDRTYWSEWGSPYDFTLVR